jgi:hypothetical protein
MNKSAQSPSVAGDPSLSTGYEFLPPVTDPYGTLISLTFKKKSVLKNSCGTPVIFNAITYKELFACNIFI